MSIKGGLKTVCEDRDERKGNLPVARAREHNLQMTKPTATPVHHRVFGEDRAIQTDKFPTEAEIDTLEALMPPCEHGWFDSCYQNSKLHYRKYLPKGNTSEQNGNLKAVVIFMHGISTHSGKAVNVDGRKLNSALKAEALLNENIALYAFDLYGHGYSEGVRFWIPKSYENNKLDYIQFCHLVAQQHSTDTPIFLMGESYGSTLTLHVARHFQDQALLHEGNATTTTETALPNLNSIILVCPAIIGDLPPFPVFQTLVFLAGYFPQWRPFFMPNPVSAARIWRDPVVLAKHTDPTCPGNIVDGSGLPFRLGTALQLVQALEDVRKIAIPGFKMPYLVLHGTEDHGVPIQGSEFLWDNSDTPMADKEFLRKEGAHHDLFGDPLAEECMHDVIAWIRKRLDPLQST